jgi:hypothetical protein
MTFAQLKAELSSRGFSHMDDDRLGIYINRAIQRLDLAHLWPYREDSATGVAPLSIPSLGQVEAVSNETVGYLLEYAGYQDLVESGCDLAETGSPTVATWPTNSDTIGVQFWKVTDNLSAAGDSPDTRFRYHMLIVDIAQQACERDRGNIQAYQSFQPDIDRQINEMVEDLLPQQAPAYTRVTWASEDN